jgi:hypothetical protein
MELDQNIDNEKCVQKENKFVGIKRVIMCT